jgi:putative sterol carrier protein
MHAIDPAAVDPAEFAEQVKTASPKALEQLMQSDLRELVLDEIFARMARHFRADKAEGLDAVIHWKVYDRPDGGYDHYEVVVQDGTCEVRKPPEAKPRVTLKLAPAHFLKLVTGNADGNRLFLRRKLKIDGDLILAARLTALFDIPEV